MRRDFKGALALLTGVTVGEPVDVMPGHHHDRLIDGASNVVSASITRNTGSERVERTDVVCVVASRHQFGAVSRRRRQVVKEA